MSEPSELKDEIWISNYCVTSITFVLSFLFSFIKSRAAWEKDKKIFRSMIPNPDLIVKQGKNTKKYTYIYNQTDIYILISVRSDEAQDRASRGLARMYMRATVSRTRVCRARVSSAAVAAREPSCWCLRLWLQRGIFIHDLSVDSAVPPIVNSFVL